MSRSFLLIPLLLLSSSLATLAADGEAAASPGMDYGFVALCSGLVFLMQAGFCLVEMGFSRAKNSINIMMKNVFDFGAGTIGFFLIGFSIMFGTSHGGMIGWDSFALMNVDSYTSEIWLFLLFQMMFATAATTIASGAMAERTNFVGYLIYAFIACVFIYPLIGHWAWGGASEGFGFGGGAGWLAEMGFRDFAGSAVVHSLGGAMALAGIIVVGARRGRFSKHGEPRIYPGHNAPLATLGVFLLTFGWFGFNMGSNLTTGPELGIIMVNTILSASAGLLAALTTTWIRKGWADLESSLNGLLGGLVGITAGCMYVAPWAALIIGIIAGVLTVFGSDFLLKLELDDSVGAIPVHLFCGIWGTIAVAIFDRTGGLATLPVQLTGALVIPASAFFISYPIFFLIHKTVGLRADETSQEHGLDFAEHSANAYPDFAVAESAVEED